MNKLLAIVFLLITSGCSSWVETPPIEKLVYVNTPLYVPSRSELPKLTSIELQCLSDTTKHKLLDRDRLLHNDLDKMELIIRSTQPTK